MPNDLGAPRPARRPDSDADPAAVPIVLLAAVAANGVIGYRGGIPWHLASDLARFRALTYGKPLLMGRKTYQSIGRPLPGRVSIVLSRSGTLAAPAGDVVVVPDLATALAVAQRTAHRLGADAIALIGGAGLFAALIDKLSRLHLTFVEMTPPGDTFFPAIDWTLWREVGRQPHLPQKGDDAAFTFVDFERRAGKD